MAQENDQWVLIREATQLLSAATGYPVSQDSVRTYADSGHLRVWRPPTTGPGHSARRISTTSIAELAEIMKMPPGPAQSAAMAALEQRNSQR